MSNNDISAFQALILDVVSYIEEQQNRKIKVSFFKGNYFCLWGIIKNRVWVSNTYEVNRFGVLDTLQDLETIFNLDLQDFIGIVNRKANLVFNFDMEA